ncbi:MULTISPECIES: amino acid permease [unclassified Amycolatopsis]|uniref:amino acid permease n=1 Tax=unclassified Amycolatopsis TaxID=2618356 RepID=UPI002874665C|nr:MULTISPECIES: amino acid permease [unclassified Amycolatopsis]MDS0132110.1 amino acid permease [Amycolatopsis sp. 505]MDS0141152.1 amino acid permease [Amycolatopsis sp. CM201R]
MTTQEKPAGGGPAPDDSSELEKFGYRQELERSLGSFSSFAAGFSYISILTGVFQLFFFGFGSGGPAFIWTWPLVFIGQFAVALCFAELAGQYPLAGSVYQWAKQIAKPATSWLAGWIMIIGAIVTAAAVAVAYQIILPQVSTAFQIVGSDEDAGLTSTPGGAQNAIILALVLVVFATIVNIIGVKLMAKINNFGVAVELGASILLVIALAIHIKRGPGLVFDTAGTGEGHSFGYLGAFLVASLMSAYVFYGFDTAGSLAEETTQPRRHAPRAILRAITAAFIVGGLIMLFGMMAVGDLSAKELSTSGMPYLLKSTLGEGLGDAFLICSAIAITVCCLAVQTAAIRMTWAMARDGRLPFSTAMAKVSPRSKTPVLPALLTGGLTVVVLLINLGNQRAFFILTSTAIILFYIPYLMVTGPMLVRRLRGHWPRPEHGPYFKLGRWGTLVNLVAVLYGAAMTINLIWPRAEVYGDDHWYFQWGAVIVTALIVIIGAIMLYVRRRTWGSSHTSPEHMPDNAPDTLPG